MVEPLVAAEGRPGVREVNGLHIATVRHFTGDSSAFGALAAVGLPGPQAPGSLAGHDPWLAWRGPQESLVLCTHSGPVQAVLKALAPGHSETAMAADLSEALIAFELHGPRIDAWLTHLVDASSLPNASGGTSRARLADVSVLLLRLAPQRLWLLGDRTVADYLRNWLTFSHEGAFFDLDPAS
jgi:sarcosine oxidase gamma subunit